LNIVIYILGVVAFIRSPSGWLVAQLFGEERAKQKIARKLERRLEKAAKQD
jgi:hypothetical protein